MPKLLSHLECADAVEKLMNPADYQNMSRHAQRYPIEHFSYALFKTEFDDALKSFIAQP